MELLLADPGLLFPEAELLFAEAELLFVEEALLHGMGKRRLLLAIQRTDEVPEARLLERFPTSWDRILAPRPRF